MGAGGRTGLIVLDSETRGGGGGRSLGFGRSMRGREPVVLVWVKYEEGEGGAGSLGFG